MSRIVETIGRPEDNRNKCISRNYVPLLLTLIVALALVVASVGYILNGGNLPNAHRGLSMITYPTERGLSPQTSDYQPGSVGQHSSIDFGTLKGKVLGPAGLPVVGASIMAEKYLGVITSVVKEGGYTANSIVNVDGTYSFKVPSGLYKITAAYPDGTNQIIENYAIWPSSSSSFDFKYI
jgi:hypothetical protein